jgi:hypothetical protein
MRLTYIPVTTLGLTEEQIDDLFEVAKDIEA